MRSEALKWVGRCPAQKGSRGLTCAILPSGCETLCPRGVDGRWKNSSAIGPAASVWPLPHILASCICLYSPLKHPYFCSTQTTLLSSGQGFTHPSLVMFLSVFLDILVDLSNSPRRNSLIQIFRKGLSFSLCGSGSW